MDHNGHKSTPYDEMKCLLDELNGGVRRGARFTTEGERSILAMSRKRDPFYSGQPSQVPHAEWFAALLDDLFPSSRRVHLRGVHYVASGAKKHPETGERIQVRKPDGALYANTEEDWNYLCEVSTWARNMGLVDPRRIADRRVRVARFAPDGPAEPPSVTVSLPAVFLPSIDVADSLEPLVTEGSAAPTGFDVVDPAREPSLVEVWAEKNLDEEDNPLIEAICRDEHANLVTGVGFMTITSVYRLLGRREKFGKPLRILYLSDFDPAGSHMPVGPARHIEFAIKAMEEKPDVRLHHLALTEEQVHELELPRMPIKESDARKKGFEARHGEGAVELNAIMEDEYLGDTERIIRSAILQLRDPRLPAKVLAARRDAETALSDELARRLHWPRRALDLIEEQSAEIGQRYHDELTALANRLAEEMSPLEERSERVLQAARRRLANLEDDVELPEVEGEESEDAAIGWLFDSRRGYLEQLHHYKER